MILLLLLSEMAFGKAAIAYSDNKDGTWAVFAEWNRSSQVLADDAALSGCKGKGGKDCKIVKSADGLCHAIAITNEGGKAWGLGSGTNQKAAQDKSVVKCLTVDPIGSCVVRKSFCDTSPSGFVPDNAAEVGGVPVTVDPGDVPCRSPKDYNACRSATGQGFGTAVERTKYCKMAFC